MRKALSAFLVLVVGGGLAWLTLRQVSSPASLLPKGLAEVSLYQGELVRLRQALTDYQAENGALASTDGREVAAVLSGKNGRSKLYLDGASWRLDQAGRLVDPWGRDFRFALHDGRMVVVEAKTP